MGAGLIDDFIRNILSAPFCPYHFVLWIPFCRAVPILVFADIADTDIANIFWADMSTDIADTDIFGWNMVKKYLHYDVLFFRLLA